MAVSNKTKIYMTNEHLDALMERLRNPAYNYFGDAPEKAAEALTTLLARAEAAEDAAKTAQFWEATAKRRMATMQKFYLRDAKLALGGDLRALRNRVAMMEAEPMQIVPSSAEETDPDLLREDRDERRRLDREYDDAGQ